MSVPAEVMDRRPAFEHQQVGAKRRSLKDIFLTLAWVTGYAAMVKVFRFVRAIETLLAGKNEASSGASSENKERNVGVH